MRWALVQGWHVVAADIEQFLNAWIVTSSWDY
jgi:hypothetical protein